MELRQLNYFLTVAETLHFGKAARKLCISEQPLSVQIKKLEQELDVKLFDRTTRSVRITPAGEAFREGVIAGMRTIDDAALRAQKIQQGLSGILRIGYASVVVNGALPALVRDFKERYPNVELVLTEYPSLDLAGVRNELQQGRVDVCMVVVFERIPGELCREILFEDKPVIALPKGHRLAQEDSIDVADLRDEAFVAHTASHGLTPRSFLVDFCRRSGFEPHIAQEVDSHTSLIGLVAAGLGVTVSIESLCGLMADKVDYRPISGEAFSVKTALFWNEGAYAGAVRNFVELGLEMFASPVEVDDRRLEQA